MTRYLCAALLAIFCVTVVGAQGARPKLTAAQQVQLFQRNRLMLQSLVDGSVEMSVNSGDCFRRSRSYSEVIEKFREAILVAARQEDASRVTELGKHLTMLINRGMIPNLKQATVQIGRNGTNWDNLKLLQRETLETLQTLQGAAQQKWPDAPAVQEMIQQLDRSQAELRDSVQD